MSHHNKMVKVQLRCACGNTSTWCVPVNRGVPPQLRCSPTGGGGGGGNGEIRCGQCGHRCFPSIGAFEKAVLQAIDRGWNKWIREGAVVIEC